MIRRLIDSDDHDSAYQLALDSFKRIESSEMLAFVTQIARLQVANSSKIMKWLEKSAKSQTDAKLNCAFARAIGYLSLRANEFDKARQAFAKILATEDKADIEVQDYTVAAYLAEKANDMTSAQQIRQQCLKDTMKIDDNTELTTDDVLSLEKK